MKKIFTILTMLILLSSLVIAQDMMQEQMKDGSGAGEPELYQVRTMEQANGTPEPQKVMEKNKEMLRNGEGPMLMNGEKQTKSNMNLMQEGEMIKAQLSNGRNAEIKIMPEVASERAMERLRLKVCSEENNCTLELKEVKQGNETRAAYRVHAEKESKLFGLFKKKMQVNADVDAETGEVLNSHKPWWAFLASEK